MSSLPYYIQSLAQLREFSTVAAGLHDRTPFGLADLPAGRDTADFEQAFWALRSHVLRMLASEVDGRPPESDSPAHGLDAVLEALLMLETKRITSERRSGA